MIFLVIVGVLLWTPSLSWGAIAFVKASTQGSCASGSSCGTSFGTLPSAGNAIAVMISCWKSGTCGTITVSDNQGVGNTYSQAVCKTEANGNSEACIFYAKSIGSTSGTFTVTASDSAASAWELVAVEYSGWDTSAPLDKTASSNAATGTADSTATVSTTQNDELSICVASISSNNSSLGITTPSGYTQRGVQNNSVTTIGFHAADKILTTTGAQQCQWSHSTTGIFGWSAVIATFKDSTTPISSFGVLHRRTP